MNVNQDEIKDSKIEEEVKKLKIKKYKTLFLLIYKIFEGVIVEKHLKDICLRYNYLSEGFYNTFIEELESLKLIDIEYISGSECGIVKLKQFVINEIEGKKAKGIKFSEDKTIMSSFKYYYIINNVNLKNTSGNYDLDYLYNKLINDTTFWNKEKSPRELYSWVNSHYRLTEIGRDSLKIAEEYENKRKNNLKQNESEENTNSNQNSEKKKKGKNNLKENKKDYIIKTNFSGLRNRRGFLDTLNTERRDVIEINNFVTIEESLEFHTIASFVYDFIFLSTNQLEDINYIYVNMYFRDFTHMKNSFDSCFVYGKDERGIIKDERNLVHKINKLSKKNMNTSLTPIKQELDRDKYNIGLVYDIDYAPTLDTLDKNRKITVFIKFHHYELYKDLYGVDKAKAMVQISKTKTEKKRAEKKEREEAIKFVTKIYKEGNQDVLLELSRFGTKRIQKLKALIDSL